MNAMFIEPFLQQATVGSMFRRGEEMICFGTVSTSEAEARELGNGVRHG
jgi:hypothetical protein